MKKTLLVVALVAFATVSTVFAEEQAKKKSVAKTSIINVCDKCQKIGLEIGKCCGQAMNSVRVGLIKGGKAIYCKCAADCKCTFKDDATKCSCGKDVKKVDLKGMYVCEKCVVISDKAGKCALCEAELKLVPSGKTKAAPAK